MKRVILTLTAVPMFASVLLAADAQQNPITGLLPMVAIFAIIYIFMIMPQQKKAKEHQKMIDNVKRDDKVLTSGGIYGTVSAVKGNVLDLKIADGVKIQIDKSAIVSLVNDTVNIPNVIEEKK
jgi:preprotein translocase subunit YajC